SSSFCFQSPPPPVPYPLSLPDALRIWKDHEALHLFASENGSITAYCRIFGPGIYFEDSSIGRVIVKESFRGSGLGHELMKRAIKSEEHTSELQSRENLVCRLLLEKKNR